MSVQQVHLVGVDGPSRQQEQENSRLVSRIATTCEHLTAVFLGPRMCVLLEAATENGRAAQHLETLDHQVIVADPRGDPVPRRD